MSQQELIGEYDPSPEGLHQMGHKLGERLVKALSVFEADICARRHGDVENVFEYKPELDVIRQRPVDTGQPLKQCCVHDCKASDLSS